MVAFQVAMEQMEAHHLFLDQEVFLLQLRLLAAAHHKMAAAALEMVEGLAAVGLDIPHPLEDLRLLLLLGKEPLVAMDLLMLVQLPVGQVAVAAVALELLLRQTEQILQAPAVTAVVDRQGRLMLLHMALLAYLRAVALAQERLRKEQLEVAVVAQQVMAQRAVMGRLTQAVAVAEQIVNRLPGATAAPAL